MVETPIAAPMRVCSREGDFLESNMQSILTWTTISSPIYHSMQSVLAVDE